MLVFFAGLTLTVQFSVAQNAGVAVGPGSWLTPGIPIQSLLLPVLSDPEVVAR